MRTKSVDDKCRQSVDGFTSCLHAITKLIINTLNTLSAECRQNGYNYFLGVSTKRAYTICTTDITHTTYYNNRQKHKPHCTTMP